MAYAPALGAGARKSVRVRVPPPALMPWQHASGIQPHPGGDEGAGSGNYFHVARRLLGVVRWTSTEPGENQHLWRSEINTTSAGREATGRVTGHFLDARSTHASRC